ncbi:MAG: hypothetical protein J0L97_03390 [Alphaproteobacteria bacterium]|nr:hypothetical protein [Alphaproteobacteria bacterium]
MITTPRAYFAFCMLIASMLGWANANGYAVFSTLTSSQKLARSASHYHK